MMRHEGEDHVEEHVSIFEDPRVDWDEVMKCPPPPMRYVEGNDAYREGKPQDANPYERGTDEHSWWDCGWCDGEGYDDWLNHRGWDDIF